MKEIIHKILDKVGFKSILAAIWITALLVLSYMVVMGYSKGQESLQTLVMTAIFNGGSFVLGYYFGTSDSSKKKDDLIKKMADGAPQIQVDKIETVNAPQNNQP